jgi:hypothetical protein
MSTKTYSRVPESLINAAQTSSIRVEIGSEPARTIKELTREEREAIWEQILCTQSTEQTEERDIAHAACRMLQAATDDELQFSAMSSGERSSYLRKYQLVAIIQAQGATLATQMEHFIGQLQHEGVRWQPQLSQEIVRGSFTHIDRTYDVGIVSDDWYRVNHPAS